jgi:hypothetical protein
VIGSLVSLAFQLVGFAVLLSWLWTRQYRSYSATAALVVGILGAIMLYDGVTLGVLEESRSRYGKVMPGLVERRWTSAEDAPYGTNYRRHDSSVRTSAGDEYQSFTRFLLTGSLDDWAIEYSYSCTVGIGICQGRDFVRRDLWSRLHVGDSVNVRQSKDETTTSRLDENPQRGLALVKVVLAGLVLGIAAALSGRLKLFQRSKYIQADATVTSVEQVRYGEESRWKVRFAYFDLAGNAQDSADEVNDPTWKAGDACFAIYRPQTPDLATLQRAR